MKRTKTRICIALLLICIIFALTSVLSSFLVGHATPHVCNGGECEICSMISSASKVLQICLMPALLSYFTGNTDRQLLFSYFTSSHSAKHITPVKLKVKLSN